MKLSSQTLGSICGALAALTLASTAQAAAPGAGLVGTWTQTQAFSCKGADFRTGEESWIAKEPLRELIFHADGRFDVTFVPFETYVDYWGTWKAGPRGRLELTVENGNRIPNRLDLEGRFRIGRDGELQLTDMWLGGLHEEGCGASFKRVGGTGQH
ncbi:hypothetical protein [Caulobacter sp. 17J80-11]|uniref:hypothetical protein n=1 Tax=Caulobacter sp. 17J80-11 TaxID=2763502 RepID=UPI0016539442|nr:hypothetical protein [Caulobacter sp. 17J80-11]MBC6981313.1 hypothetical protein [Caulobacter sp. 17J80-11]